MRHGEPQSWDKVVVVPTYGRNLTFLEDCLRSLAGYEGAPIIVAVTAADDATMKAVEALLTRHTGLVAETFALDSDTSELGGLYVAWQRTGAAEIFLLHDSCEVIDHRLFEIAFEQLAGAGVPMLRQYEHVWVSCLGKYRREVLDQLDPAMMLPSGRQEAMEAEIAFTSAYSKAEPNLADFPEPMQESEEIILHHGRKNHVMENAFLKKWKASWSIDHIFDAAGHKRGDAERSASETRMAHGILEEYFGKPE